MFKVFKFSGCSLFGLGLSKFRNIICALEPLLLNCFELDATSVVNVRKSSARFLHSACLCPKPPQHLQVNCCPVYVT